MAKINAKVVGKVTAPEKPVREAFENVADFNTAMAEYEKEIAEFEAEQAEAKKMREAAAAGPHGPADMGPGAGSPNYDDGNIRVMAYDPAARI